MLNLSKVLPPPQLLEWPQSIIFDVDCTLWPMEEVAADAAGVPREIYYKVYTHMENPEISDEQKKILTNLYADARIFENMQFFDGAEEILKFRELGLRVIVLSNSMSEAVVQTKHDQILNLLPDLGEENLILNNLGIGSDKPKSLPDHTLIFVDDSPNNVAKSTANINVLRKMAWNQSEQAQEKMADKIVVSFDTLKEINDYLWTELDLWFKKYNFTPPRDIF